MNTTESHAPKEGSSGKLKQKRIKGPWLVVNMTGKWKGDVPIPRCQQPTVVHQTIEAAAKECVRLAEQNEGMSFGIFEAINVVSHPKKMVW